jgi:hypothetical protein
MITIDIYSRYGMFNRMMDGFCDQPNRQSWTLAKLYTDWEAHGFLTTLRSRGAISVSYDGIHFNKFHLTNDNLHQIIALSCFLDSTYAKDGISIKITAPHASGGQFAGTFKAFKNGDVEYINENNNRVLFTFDSKEHSLI